MLAAIAPPPQRGQTVPIKLKIAFSLFVFVVTGASAYLFVTVYRSWLFYRHIKTADYGFRGNVLRGDPVVGYAPREGAKGSIELALGPGVPMAFDHDGFRIVPREKRVIRRPVIMTLGCSFTFGDACAVEDTFARRLARHLGGTDLNAGVPGYGLAQMLLRGQYLIPRHKPDIVVVQYSRWLVERSQDHFAPFSRQPKGVPFYAGQDGGQPRMHYPVFVSPVFRLPVSWYRGKPPGARDFCSFLYRVGFRLFPSEDLHVAWYRLKRFLSVIPFPTFNGDAVAEIAFKEMAQVCRSAGARMVIVVLGGDARPMRVPEGLTTLGVPIVNAHAALLSRLPEQTDEAYFREYAHFRGDPPRMIDEHPNPRAHAVIAETIAKELGQATRYSR